MLEAQPHLTATQHAMFNSTLKGPLLEMERGASCTIAASLIAQVSVSQRRAWAMGRKED